MLNAQRDYLKENQYSIHCSLLSSVNTALDLILFDYTTYMLKKPEHCQTNKHERAFNFA